MRIRRGKPGDVEALVRLENACFEESRRVAAASLRCSVASRHQEVWVLGDGAGGLVAALVLRLHARTCRVLSIAVAPAERGAGLGSRLLAAAVRRASRHGCERIHLEVDARDEQLLAWYARFGFVKRCRLAGYYGTRRDAWRLRLRL